MLSLQLIFLDDEQNFLAARRELRNLSKVDLHETQKIFDDQLKAIADQKRFANLLTYYNFRILNNYLERGRHYLSNVGFNLSESFFKI